MNAARTLLLVSCVSSAGCGSSPDQNNPTLRVDQVGIEPDVELVPEPGRGAAVHVEYRSGGQWTVVLTCDTELSGYVCDYDVILSVEPPLELGTVRVRDFEREDYWYRIDSGAIRILAFTGFDRDELSLRTDPDAVLRLDALLDGSEVPSAVAWAADGAVRTGAPTLPLEFVPQAP
jgi:hypothetical protein